MIKIKESIITHPGSAHPDDFLSCCLIIYKMGNIDAIYRKDSLNEEEINDTAKWKIDVGEIYDPSKKCFDHHKNGITNDCALSLILKHWGLWEKACNVHNWLEITVINDAISPSEVANRLKISRTAMGALDSFIERSLLNHFEQREVIEKIDPLFSLMEIIGKRFFKLIEEYYFLLDPVKNNILLKRIKGVPIALCYKGFQHSSTLVRIIKEKMREKWPNEKGGIAVYPNKRKPNTIAIKRLSDYPGVDFTRLSDYEKKVFCHDGGFFISVEQMPEKEIERYIRDAIKV